MNLLDAAHRKNKPQFFEALCLSGRLRLPIKGIMSNFLDIRMRVY
jgi:hypothetical protein